MHKRGLALLEAGDEIGAKAMLDELLATTRVRRARVPRSRA